MSIGLLFWVLMILCALFGGGVSSGAFTNYTWGWNWLLWILLFLLGWKVFGFILQA